MQSRQERVLFSDSPSSHFLTNVSFSVQGPLAGATVSAGLLLLGLTLTSFGVTDVGVDTPAFKDSLLVSVHDSVMHDA